LCEYINTLCEACACDEYLEASICVLSLNFFRISLYNHDRCYYSTDEITKNSANSHKIFIEGFFAQVLGHFCVPLYRLL
jgi:hypothetical protein